MSSSFGETPVADSVESAAQRVATHIQNTIDSADVYNKLTQNGSTPVSGLGDKFYTKGTPEFVLKRRISIPEELSHQIKNMRSQFSMGLFPEITRAWVVIDSDIFMWNYETNDDLAYFDAVQNTVLKVALVRVKSDVFASHITHGLVVGTVTDLSLYPVIMDSDPSSSISGMAIDASHYFKITLDNSTINDIVSTNNGRVFFTADDKLYEFIYEIAITTKGVRIYFSVVARNVAYLSGHGQYLSQLTSKSLSQQDVRPQCLRVAHVRFSPEVAPTSIYRDAHRGVSIAYADQSICVMATTNRHIVWALSDIFHPNTKVYCESMNDLHVTGNVWAIAPVSDKIIRTLPPEPGMLPRLLPHSFFRQSIEQRRRLIICSNEGVHEFQHLTPRDALQDALFEGGVEGRATVQLWQQLGPTEVLVLALSILTSEAAIDERIKDKVHQFYSSYN
uniref:Nucleoporin_N domain-containing protein n=1 Tax=Heterorhabditis bacteriophora TaxID=37862 RepID=A0A1I7X780_HETBA